MCMDPVSMMVAGAVIGGAGQVYSGVQANKAGRENGAALDQQAVLREEKAEYDAAESGRRFTRDQGTKQAAAAATGIDIQSFADVFADDASESALELAAIRYGGAQDATNIRRQASASRKSGKNALIGSVFAAAGGGFSAAGKASTVKSPSSSYAPHEN